MARVTKINVGGTNYDIAHEGELKNSGFEVVTSLPRTNLFVGRQVMYNGQLYVYNGSQWVNVNAPYEANLRWGGRNITYGYSPIDAAMVSELSANLMAFPNPAGITVEYSRDGGVTWLDYGVTNERKILIFSKLGASGIQCGNIASGEDAVVGYQVRVTVVPETCGVYSELNKIILYVTRNGSNSNWCTFSGLKYSHVVNGETDDSFYDVIINKQTVDGWSGFNVLNFNTITTALAYNTHLNKYYKLRLTFGYDRVTEPSYGGLSVSFIGLYGNGRWVTHSNLAKYNHLYNYDFLQNALFPAKVESKEVVNFDINNIEPTQTGNVTKTSTWLWQYLTQAVNWLKANNVRLSGYNAKVAELVQADSDNNASIQSVSTDLTELSNGLATVATSGSYNDLTDKPTLFSGSYNDLTDKPNLATVATSGSYNDLTNKPTLATVATSGSYDDLLNRPDLVFSNIGGNIATAQITDGSITNAKLANSSMTLNDTTVNLGDTAILPWYVDYNEVDYPARIREHWLQIYRNGVWANLMYLGDILPTQVGQITSLADLDWYNEQVSEYEVDSNTTTSILNGTTKPAALLLSCTAEQLTLNLYPINGKQYGKGSLDSLISDLQGKGFSVFVENDLDAIIGSGSDYLVRIKISKVPTPKAIIECYVAR